MLGTATGHLYYLKRQVNPRTGLGSKAGALRLQVADYRLSASFTPHQKQAPIPLQLKLERLEPGIALLTLEATTPLAASAPAPSNSRARWMPGRIDP